MAINSPFSLHFALLLLPLFNYSYAMPEGIAASSEGTYSTFDTLPNDSNSVPSLYTREPLEVLVRWLNEHRTGSDYALERFRKYNPTTADRSFIRFGRQALAHSAERPEITGATFRAKPAMWLKYAINSQYKRPSEMMKDTSFIRFGKR